MTLWHIISIVWSVFGILWVVQHAENPHSAWAWILLMFICPPLCTLILILIGNQTPKPRNHNQNIYNNRLSNLIFNECNSRLTLHNRVKTLHDAAATYSEILRALHHAKRSIHVAYYIISDDAIGKTLLDILARKASAGVEVALIYDALGSWQLSKQRIKELSARKIQVRSYSPLRLRTIGSLNRRNHRKLLIIDHHTLFLGGINIATRYLYPTRSSHWRDEHIRIDGDAARQAEELFAADWQACGGSSLSVPKIHSRSSIHCPIQLVWSITEQPYAIHRTYSELIASAKHSIIIATPYFTPTEELVESLIKVARSGVKVEIILPARSDIRLIDYASQHYIERCSGFGVDFYLYRHGFMHSKLIIVDSMCVGVGSANFDYRSMRYNAEIMALIFNRQVVRSYVQTVRHDMAACQPLVPFEQRKKSAKEQLLSSLARLLAPLL